MIFFVTNTRNCRATKLYKLLFYLDFEHFRQTGRSVTGQRYFAFPMGPVPASLNKELRGTPGQDLASTMIVKPLAEIDNEAGGNQLYLKARINFDEKLFTARELKILNLQAEIFKDVTAKQISLISHDKGEPWDFVYAGGKGNGSPIPFELVLDESPDSISYSEAEDRAEEALELDQVVSR